MKSPAVYIMASKKNGTIYTGVTSNLIKRVYEHKNSITKGFTSRYGCKFLVFLEFHSSMYAAIEREKELKRMSRKEKVALIEASNLPWKDLYQLLF